MANQNLTIYQKLTRMLGFPNQVRKDPPTFNFNKDEILKNLAYQICTG